MLKAFRPNGLPNLGERRDETIACRAALGERFLKGKALRGAKGGQSGARNQPARICERAHRFRERPTAAVTKAEM
jgi:hypothetical protein